MSDQHDAPPPPAEAMAHMLHMLPPRETGTAFASLRTLPAAARWRLIAWLAKGLEPTPRMVQAMRESMQMTPSCEMYRFSVARWLSAALAAAEEAGDGE